MGNSSATRRFEYKEEKSSKFWEIQVEGNGFTVRYGKIGTDGQTQAKEFSDAATAEKQAQKLIAEKTGKGYQEVCAGGATSSQADPVITENDSKRTITQTSSLPAPLTIARNPNIPKEYICSPFDRGSPWNKYDLTEDDRSEILDALLENPATPDSFLLSQTNDSNWERIASRCGPDALRSESFKYGWWLHEVRGGENLARGALLNPRCPSDILEKIFVAAFDEWQLDPDDIQHELALMAGHPNASRELLHKLSETDDPSVIERLASNLNCDVDLREHVLAKLMKERSTANMTRVPSKKKMAALQKVAAGSETIQPREPARKHAGELIAEKSSKGYQEIGGQTATCDVSDQFLWNLSVSVVLNCDDLPKMNAIAKYFDPPCMIKGSRKLLSSRCFVGKSSMLVVDMDLQFATNKAINSEDVIGQFTKRRTVEAVEIKVFNRTDQAQSCITNI